MNVVHRQTIRTGHPVTDDQMLEQMRAHAASQGCELVVQRIPEGGYQVDVVRANYGAPPPQPPPPPPQYGMQPYAQPPQGQMQLQPMQAPAQPNVPVAQFRGAQPFPAQRALAASGVCQVCGRHAPTKQVTFHQNIGAVVIRFPKTITGQLCRSCISTYFWKYTLTSFFLGWWGVISFFYTIVTIPMNIFTFFGAMSLPREFPPNQRA